VGIESVGAPAKKRPKKTCKTLKNISEFFYFLPLKFFHRPDLSIAWISSEVGSWRFLSSVPNRQFLFSPRTPENRPGSAFTEGPIRQSIDPIQKEAVQ
jgi:hypothetical protein